jgi:hypothetical protein
MKNAPQNVSPLTRELSQHIATAIRKPLTRAEEEEKALDLMAPVLGSRRSRARLVALWNFDKLKDVRVAQALRQITRTRIA